MLRFVKPSYESYVTGLRHELLDIRRIMRCRSDCTATPASKLWLTFFVSFFSSFETSASEAILPVIRYCPNFSIVFGSQGFSMSFVFTMQNVIASYVSFQTFFDLFRLCPLLYFSTLYFRKFANFFIFFVSFFSLL